MSRDFDTIHSRKKYLARLMSEIAVLRNAVELAERQQHALAAPMVTKKEPVLLAFRSVDGKAANDDEGPWPLLQFPENWYGSC